VFGEYDDQSNPDCRQGICAPPVQVIKIKNAVVHSKFDIVKIQYDIGIIRLLHKIAFNGEQVSIQEHMQYLPKIIDC